MCEKNIECRPQPKNRYIIRKAVLSKLVPGVARAYRNEIIVRK